MGGLYRLSPWLALLPIRRTTVTQRNSPTQIGAAASIGPSRNAARLVAVFVLAAAFGEDAGPVAAQEAPPAASAGAEASGAGAALPAHPDSAPTGDLLSPQNLLQFEYQAKTTDGKGSDGALRTVTTDTFKLRGDIGIALDNNSQIVLRGDLPYLAKNPVTDGNPGGDFLYGIGDADVQGAIIHQFDARWSAGAGLRLVMPTGDSALGSQKWQTMPIAGVRYALPEISSGSYFEPLARYDVSVGGNPQARNISNLQFAPMLNVSLPNRWFFTFYPSTDIRWNFGDPITGQTGRLFLPFDFRIGKKFTDSFNVSLEISEPIVKQYPVYKFMTALRFNFTF
jgi:hypothetical protein